MMTNDDAVIAARNGGSLTCVPLKFRNRVNLLPQCHRSSESPIIFHRPLVCSSLSPHFLTNHFPCFLSYMIKCNNLLPRKEINSDDLSNYRAIKFCSESMEW